MYIYINVISCAFNPYSVSQLFYTKTGLCLTPTVFVCDFFWMYLGMQSCF